MEIKINTQQILRFLYVISWIIFLGVCIEAGSFIFNGIFTIAINSKNASYLDLTNLYKYDSGYYLVVLILMSIVAVMRAIIFYMIIKILHAKKLDMSQPFNKEMGRFMFNLSYLSFGAGVFSIMGAKYTTWLVGQGVKMPDIENLRLGGADVWLFMGIILFIIAQIFKRGIEIQSENDLTI